MKVTMIQSVSSVDGSFAADCDYDLPEILAKQWVRAGYATPVLEEEAPVEAEAPAPTPVEPPKPAGKRGPKPKADAPAKADLL